MKRWMGLVVLFGVLSSGVALASHDEHAPAGGPVDKNKETADFILHHVADGEEFEFEWPFPPYHLFTVHISEAFAPLKWESVPGACEKPVSAAMVSFPSLGKFLDGCYDFRPTKAILMMWVACAFLLLLAFGSRKRDQNGVPKGMLAHIVESLALFIRDEIVVPNIGKKEAARYTIFLTSLFFFILAVNWLGLIPGFFTGTGVITVTAALAVITFVLTQVAGIRSAGLGGYLGHLTGGVPPALWPIMIPVEVIGLFTKPFALLVRLFANMLGGHMVVFFLLSLVFLLHWGAAAVAVPLTAAIFLLEIFVGILQAYLFVLLSSLFIGQAVAMGDHGHGDAHGEDKAH